MREVWVVEASWGFYDDHSTEIIAGYDERAPAEEHARAANAVVSEKVMTLVTDEWGGKRYANPYEPGALYHESDLDSIEYHAYPILILDTVDDIGKLPEWNEATAKQLKAEYEAEQARYEAERKAALEAKRAARKEADSDGDSNRSARA